MNKNKKSSYVYFRQGEETVFRDDETQKKAITKLIKRKKTTKIAIKVISVISAVALTVSGFSLGKDAIERFLVLKQEQQQKGKAEIPKELLDELENLSEEDKWARLYEKYPELVNVKFPAGILCDYALYYADNPQTVGYIKIEGTNVDSPVVQADNNKYYLNHDFYGKATSYGSIYATYKCGFKPFHRNTLIYGHNMNDGSRFADLTNYKSLDYFKEHPVIQFDSIYEKKMWKIYAAVITNGSVESDNGYFFDFTFNHCSDTCYEEYLEEIDKRKLYTTGVDILPTDKIITLCTCTYEYDDARLIVIAREVREGESTEVNTTLAEYKTTPVKYPDSYYKDENSNPYKNDKKFYLY